MRSRSFVDGATFEPQQLPFIFVAKDVQSHARRALMKRSVACTFARGF